MPTLPPELRQVPPDSFVATRDALSRRLRQSGDREAAAEVRRLRRPPPPLWALNQLAVVAPDRVAALVQAGEALRATTQAALQGEQAALGRLSSEHARLVDDLTGRGMEVLTQLQAPSTTDTRSRLWSMLRVASLDPDLAPALASGSLAEEPVSSGFDGLLGFEIAAQPRRAKTSTAPEGAGSPEAVPDRAEDTEATPEEGARSRRERGAELRVAEAQVTHARADATRSRERRHQAHERLDRLRAQLEAAKRESAQADRDLAAAEEAVAAAETAAERLQNAGS